MPGSASQKAAGGPQGSSSRTLRGTRSRTLRASLPAAPSSPAPLRVQALLAGLTTCRHPRSFTCLSPLPRSGHPCDTPPPRVPSGVHCPCGCLSQFAMQKSFSVASPNPHLERPRKSERSESPEDGAAGAKRSFSVGSGAGRTRRRRIADRLLCGFAFGSAPSTGKTAPPSSC